jgi:hypothetical protein
MQPVSAKIFERRLTVVDHNTWIPIRNPAFLGLSTDSQGDVVCSSSLMIPDFVLHP